MSARKVNGVRGIRHELDNTTDTLHDRPQRERRNRCSALAARHECRLLGDLDGSFIYGMRAYSGRPDLRVVRLDKIMFHDLAVYFDVPNQPRP